MDKKNLLDCLWILTLCSLCSFGLANPCEVDDGVFYTTIIVQEEADIGSVVGSLKFVAPDSIASVKVVDSNPLFYYNSSNNSFVVTSRIDIDNGLNTVQVMILECMSMGGPPLEIDVEFELKDINDFTPEFVTPELRPTNQYMESVSEATVVGTPIALVQAKDGDIKNSYIIYELLPSEHSSYFQLKTVAGGKAAISLEHTLDYEDKREYNLTIVAKDCQNRKDCSTHQKSTTALVTIAVEDADDLSPEFDPPTYTVSIFEDSIQDTVVAQLVARDQDELNDPVRYSISGEGSQYFSVDIHTGMVTVSNTQGMVKGTQYLLQAKAWQENDENKKTTTTLVIKIVPTNGNAPQFSEQSYDITLSEGSPVDTSALSFTVSDRDTTEQLKFSMVNYPAQFPFQLIVTGLKSADLVVSEPLDYETTQTYSVVIQVSDGEFMSKADVRISILNENDHNPEFQDEPYEFEVDWKEDAIVGAVHAIDKDASEDDFSSVKYKILPPDDMLFKVNNQGVITLNAEAEEYKDKDVYFINVQAMDKGKSPRSSTTVVKIAVSTPMMTSKDKSTSEDSSKQSADRLAIYIVAGIAGFLLIMVTLLVIYFLRRKAKKTARQLHKKDCEQITSCDTPYTTIQPSDTLRSVTDSQMTYKTQTTLLVSEDDNSQSGLEMGSGLVYQSELERNVSSHDYSDMLENEKHQIPKRNEPNNLSVASDNEQECMEIATDTENNSRNIMATNLNLSALRSTNDSGRSSMKDRSPYVKRVPFQSFLHPKSSSIDETGHYSHDEEIALATLQNRTSRGLAAGHSNSFNTGHYRPNVSNIRATADDTLRPAAASQRNLSSSVMTEAPEGFRSEYDRAASPQSGTSDYESNSPSPGLTSNTMIDYCADLPTQMKDTKVRLPMVSSFSHGESSWPKKTISGSLYADKAANGLSVAAMERSDTPCSEVSTETDSVCIEERPDRPQMTIYF